jgi:peptidyl-prolyl cis-trans isomerase B (cyclophilin B)
MKKILSLILAFIMIFTLTASLTSCKEEAIDVKSAYTTKTPTVDHETNFVQIELECGAYIVIQLYPGTAPITVANFKKLVNEHFYDGIIFHRVIENFMIQGGDPQGTGLGGSGETIYG